MVEDLDLASSDEEQLTKKRVKKVKIPKIAETKEDDKVEDAYENSLPPAKKQRKEKSQKQLEGFKKAQQKRAENIQKRKEQKEEELVNKVLARKKAKQPEPEPEPLVESSGSSSESEEEVYVAPPKKKKAPKKAPPPKKKKSKKKVVVYMSSSSDDDSDSDSESDESYEEPAPKKRSRIGRITPSVKPDLENLNYRTYFA
jgi:hypothetical protein